MPETKPPVKGKQCPHCEGPMAKALMICPSCGEAFAKSPKKPAAKKEA